MPAESARARQAWADYVALGPERSLEKLLAHYRERGQTVAGSVPTTRLNTLKQWSAAFGWQARLQGVADQAAREATEAQAAYVRDIMQEGFALAHERVKALKKLGTWLEGELDDPDLRWLKEKKSIIVGQTEIVNDKGKVVGTRSAYETFWVHRPNVGWVSKLLEALDDIAQETQGRIRRTEVTGKDGAAVALKVYTDARMADPLEADWSDAPPARSSADR